MTVDDQLIASFWRKGEYKQPSTLIFLLKGYHKVEVDYYKDDGPYQFSVHIEGPGLRK
jgi:hypothetical protein